MSVSAEGRIFVVPGPSDALLLTRDPAGVARARQWLSQLLKAYNVPTIRCQDSVLMVSELVTNGLRHGQGGVVLRASVSGDGTIMLAVNDAGDHNDNTGPRVQEVDLNRIGGMGLRIVQSLSTDWGVVRYPGGTTVWAVLAGSAERPATGD